MARPGRSEDTSVPIWLKLSAADSAKMDQVLARHEFEGWTRSGVPQAIHSHVFRARSTRVLREEARDVIDALLERGITPSDVRFGEGFEDDVALSSRRLVYEAVLRRKVEAQARIESGDVLGKVIMVP